MIIDYIVEYVIVGLLVIALLGCATGIILMTIQDRREYKLWKEVLEKEKALQK